MGFQELQMQLPAGMGLMLAQDDGPAITGVPSDGSEAITTTSGDPNAIGDQSGAGTTGAKPSSGGLSPMMMLLPLVGVFLFMMWSSSSSQKKDRKRREEMLAGISKHSKVQTSGGVIGTVVEVKDTEVVLKVDEANNVKMRFAKSAVQEVFASEDDL